MVPVTSDTGSAKIWIRSVYRFFLLKTHESSSRQAIAAKAHKDRSTPTPDIENLSHPQ